MHTVLIILYCKKYWPRSDDQICYFVIQYLLLQYWLLSVESSSDVSLSRGGILINNHRHRSLSTVTDFPLPLPLPPLLSFCLPPLRSRPLKSIYGIQRSAVSSPCGVQPKSNFVRFGLKIWQLDNNFCLFVRIENQILCILYCLS